MAQLRNANDIKIAVLKRCGEVIDGTSSYDTDVIMYMNKVYRGIVSGGNVFDTGCGEPWIWATASHPQLLTMQLPYETGTVNVVNGSATVTFSSAPTVSVANWYLKIENRDDYFRITAHTALATTATIDMSYPDTTATGLVFRVMKLQYALPTPVCRLIAPMVTYHSSTMNVNSPDGNKIYEVDYTTFIRKYPLTRMQADVPDRYCVTAHDTDDNVTVQFNSYLPSDGIPLRVEVPYIPVVDDLTDSTSSVPVIPLGFRDILLHGAAYYIMADKADSRVDLELSLAKGQLQALINHNRKQLSLAGTNYGKLVPRAGRNRINGIVRGGV